MMPELGKYAETVLSAYVVSIILIVALVGISIYRSKKIKKKLQDVENRMKNNG
jgi:heme exporter protein D